MKRPSRAALLVSAVWLAPALFAVIDDIGQRRLHGGESTSLRDIIWTGGDWLVYAILTPPVFWVSRRWPIVKPSVVGRALLHIVFALSSASAGRRAASSSR